MPPLGPNMGLAEGLRDSSCAGREVDMAEVGSRRAIGVLVLGVALIGVPAPASAEGAGGASAVAMARRVAALPVAASVAVKKLDAARVGSTVQVAALVASAMAAKAARREVAKHVADKTLHLPLLKGRVVSWYGTASAAHSNTRVRHTGWTVVAPRHSRVRSVALGEVVFAGARKGYGQLVIVAHPGGYHSVYAHLSEIRVALGERVTRGQALGVIGSTGSLNGVGLYFEWRHHGRSLNPQGWFAPANTETTLQ